MMKRIISSMFIIFQFSFAFADSDLIIVDKIKIADTCVDSISYKYVGNRMQLNKWVELFQKGKKEYVYNLFYPLLKGDSVILYKIRIDIPKSIKYKYVKLSNENNVQFHFGKNDEKYIISIRQGDVYGFETCRSFSSNILYETPSQSKIRLLYFFQEEMSREDFYFIGNDNELVFLVKCQKSKKKLDRLTKSISSISREGFRIMRNESPESPRIGY